jgi:hypothetical protein
MVFSVLFVFDLLLQDGFPCLNRVIGLERSGTLSIKIMMI